MSQCPRTKRPKRSELASAKLTLLIHSRVCDWRPSASKDSVRERTMLWAKGKLLDSALVGSTQI
jgi:hypothetical protein